MMGPGRFLCLSWWQITYKIFAKKDDLTSDGYIVDKILDKTGMKGESECSRLM
jgi:6-phosphogluconate dehydrogenase